MVNIISPLVQILIFRKQISGFFQLIIFFSKGRTCSLAYILLCIFTAIVRHVQICLKKIRHRELTVIFHWQVKFLVSLSWTKKPVLKCSEPPVCPWKDHPTGESKQKEKKMKKYCTTAWWEMNSTSGPNMATITTTTCLPAFPTVHYAIRITPSALQGDLAVNPRLKDMKQKSLQVLFR